MRNRLTRLLFVVVLLATVVSGCKKDDSTQPLLHEAIEKNDIALVKSLLNSGVDVNIKNNKGSTPLHKAAWRGSIAIIEILIANGSDVNAKSDFALTSGPSGQTSDWTPLHAAAWIGRTAIAEILLDNGAVVNARNSLDRTPLHYAASADHNDIVKLLLSNGADVNIKDKDNITPLDKAIYHQHIETGRLLIEHGAKATIHNAAGVGDTDAVKNQLATGITIDARDREGNTPLHLATSREMVEFLLANGADINSRNEYGFTPLHMAAKHENVTRAAALLDNGADVNAKDKDENGKTPLSIAVFKGESAVATVELLLANGADVNIKDKAYNTLLHRAVGMGLFGMGHKEIMKVLLENGADANIKDQDYNTPLDLAMELHQVEIGRLLVEHGAKVTIHIAAWMGDIDAVKNQLATGITIDTRDSRGMTLLHVASHKEMAEFLLANGADINSENKDDETPLHMAALHNKVGLAEALLDNGADVNIRISGGAQTPLLLAVIKNNVSMVELLLANGADANASTNDGRTPLDVAVTFRKSFKEPRHPHWEKRRIRFHKRYDDIVKMLRKHGAK